ncbi:protein YIPF5-like [Diaphorina citri]|uniref:Protein YIPF5-like n=1 Tax=Diaphorina citri TaxID=121845 RepID=A0A1S3DGH8_DIACI|nr:protein YIPF5-like [Diaphorina citri]
MCIITNIRVQSPVSAFDKNQYTSPKRIYANNFEDEVPLLEELEIEPDKIIKRMLLILESPVSAFDKNQYTSPKRIYTNNFEDEVPLLEELEIEPDKIIKRMLLILDPFNSCVYLEEYDLMGPIMLCFLLPSILLLSAKAYFSHVIGFGVLCSLFMYCLLNVMSPQPVVATTVVSVLGYGLLPQIILAMIGILMPLYSMLGFILAFVCVLWSSFATSRIFNVLMNTQHQSLLIAYPCALLYSVFTLLVLF